jgi:hypothetical protein
LLIFTPDISVNKHSMSNIMKFISILIPFATINFQVNRQQKTLLVLHKAFIMLSILYFKFNGK